MFDVNTFMMEYPEFRGLEPCMITKLGEREDCILSDTAWGCLREQALHLRIAHRIALRFNIGSQYSTNGLRNGSSSGIVTSKSASNGSLSESSQLNSFVNSDNPIYADFGRTEYGLEYLRLMEETLPEGNVILSRSVGDVIC